MWTNDEPNLHFLSYIGVGNRHSGGGGCGGGGGGGGGRPAAGGDGGGHTGDRVRGPC